ncbi:MAG: hypothetical protein HYZ53_21710 [Planctomycetes bacterium]|nr:hypothetical protein [Planctomycetota bacterium]
MDPRWQDYRKERFPGVVKAYREALGEDLELSPDWASIPYPPTGPGILDFWLKGILRDLGNNGMVCSDGERLTRIRLRHVDKDAERACTLVEGTLDLGVDLTRRMAGQLGEKELESVLDEGLERSLTGHVERLRYVSLPDLEAGLESALGLRLRFEIDWSVVRGDRATPYARRLQCAKQLELQVRELEAIERRLPRSLLQQLGERVRVWRLEPLPAPAARELLGDAGTLLLRFSSGQGPDGYFGADELGRELPGVLAGLPTCDPSALPPPPSADPEGTALARRLLEAYRGADFLHQVEELRRFLGKRLSVQIDWESFAASPPAARRLPAAGLGRLCAAWGLLQARRKSHAQVDSEDNPEREQAEQMLRRLPDVIARIHLRQTRPGETGRLALREGEGTLEIACRFEKVTLGEGELISELSTAWYVGRSTA